MTMKISIYRKLFLTLLWMTVSHVLYPQTTSLVKTLEQSFDVKPDANLELTNKYGDIIVNGWEKNEISVHIRITAFGKDDDDAKKMMDRVEFDFNVSKEYVIIETIMDRDKGVLSEFFSAIGDYSKSLLNKNEMDIDFEVNVPYNSSLDIENKFGDVVINDVKGKITVDQSHGNFKSGNLIGFSRITVNYGNIDINSVALGNISIRGGDLELRKGEKIDVSSNSSRLFLKQIDHIKLNSSSDKIRITDVKSIIGNSSFSNVDIYHLTDMCNLIQSYGELIIHAIEPGFSVIKLNGKSTDYNLSFRKGSSFSANIKAREDKLTMIDYPKNVQKGYVDDKQKIVHLQGYYGSHEDPQSIFELDTSNGEVIIDFVPQTN